jgi:hypothetical protein
MWARVWYLHGWSSCISSGSSCSGSSFLICWWSNVAHKSRVAGRNIWEMKGFKISRNSWWLATEIITVPRHARDLGETLNSINLHTSLYYHYNKLGFHNDHFVWSLSGNGNMGCQPFHAIHYQLTETKNTYRRVDHLRYLQHILETNPNSFSLINLDVGLTQKFMQGIHFKYCISWALHKF